MKKITAYIWAFIVAIVLFFTAGVCTLGSVKTAGDSMTVVANAPVYYDLGGNMTVKAVYVNIGSIHGEVGKDATITVKKTTSSTTAAEASWSMIGSSVKVGNITSKENKSGAQYNWIALVSGDSVSARKISFASDVNLELCEIVVVNSAGSMLPLMPYTQGSVYQFDDVACTLDSQENFAEMAQGGNVILENNAFSNFTQEEGYYMSAVQNLLSGKEEYSGSVYVVDGNFNYLATLLMAPSVALFGVSPFALRLPAFIATCLLIVFAFLLMKELTKSDKYAFLFSIVCMLGGLATTVGRLGAPYTMVASALVASLYFMYRFFAHGITSKNIKKGSMNVLISGCFAAIAMAMDTTAIIPVLGILVLFGFGMKRQKAAHEVALAKVSGQAQEETDEATSVAVIGTAANRENALFNRKNRLACGMAALGFFMVTAFLILFAGVLAYSSYVRANGSSVNFLALLWDGFVGGVRDNGVTAFTADNRSVILSWLLPFHAATLYTGVAATGSYLSWSVLPNVAASVAALLAFIACTVKVIMDLVKKQEGKKELRVRRMYLVLVGGMVAAIIAGLIRGNFSAIGGSFFQIFYLGFLPLALMSFVKEECAKCKTVANMVSVVLVAVVAILFVIGIPAMYGFAVSASYSNWFVWML